MRRPGLIAAAFLLSAGCIGNAADQADLGVEPTPPFDLAALYDVEHDHADPALHTYAWNMDPVASLALTDDGVPVGLAGEIDVARDIAAVHYEGARSGFVLLNVSDPTHPRMLSFASAEAFRPFEGRDVKLDPAAEYAYFALQPGAAMPPQDAAGAPTGGFLVYDIRDPARPQFVTQAVEAGRGCHMIRYWESGETRVVYCASTQGLSIWQLVEGPAGPRTPVKLPGYFAPSSDGLQRTLVRYLNPTDPVGSAFGVAVTVQPHDVTAQLDPLTGDPILVVPYEHYGIWVLDIADPTMPSLLGAWEWEGAEYIGRMHTALITAVGDRRIAIGVNEAAGDDITPVTFVDMTDWAAPVLLTQWTPPVSSHGATFSAHNHQVVGTTMYMGHFHGGVWVFDIADPAKPRVTAVYQVAQPHAPEGAESPSVWDVVVHRGYLLVSDMPSGLVVLHHAGDPAGSAEWRSFV